MSDETTTYTGSCHCGAVRFEVDLARGFTGSRCNCSVCVRTSVTSSMVKPAAFRLLTGEAGLGSYQWGAKISTRHFCPTCGVHCFGRGHLAEIGGDFVAVNLNCIDAIEPTTIEIQHWDGRHDNWQGGPRATPWPVNA